MARGTQTEKMLTVAEAARVVGVSREAVRRWVRDGHLPALALGPPPRPQLRVLERHVRAMLRPLVGGSDPGLAGMVDGKPAAVRLSGGGVGGAGVGLVAVDEAGAVGCGGSPAAIRPAGSGVLMAR